MKFYFITYDTMSTWKGCVTFISYIHTHTYIHIHKHTHIMLRIVSNVLWMFNKCLFWLYLAWDGIFPLRHILWDKNRFPSCVSVLLASFSIQGFSQISITIMLRWHIFIGCSSYVIVYNFQILPMYLLCIQIYI